MPRTIIEQLQDGQYDDWGLILALTGGLALWRAYNYEAFFRTVHPGHRVCCD